MKATGALPVRASSRCFYTHLTAHALLTKTGVSIADNVSSMVSIYDAVISSYECNDRALADAWAIAEHQRQEDLMKNIIKLYAALLVDDNKSNVKRGYLITLIKLVPSL